MIKVLIVDDHCLIRSGVTKLLSSAEEIKVIGEAKDGEEAIRLLSKKGEKKNKPDVVLMDLQMPGIGGIEATRRLLRIDSSIKILVLTVCDNIVFPRRVLEAGASGYITKGTNVDEMINAIRLVHLGGKYVAPDIAQRMAVTKFADSQSSFDSLSKRELEIMMLVLRGQKARSIAETLNLSPKTVNTYRYRIFDKLDIKNDVELTRLALSHGIVGDDIACSGYVEE